MLSFTTHQSQGKYEWHKLSFRIKLVFLRNSTTPLGLAQTSLEKTYMTIMRYYTRRTSYRASLLSPKGNYTQCGPSLVVLLQSTQRVTVEGIGNWIREATRVREATIIADANILENLTIQEELDLEEVMCTKEV